MPQFKITDTVTGKAVTVSGDSAPSHDEAEQIFNDAGLRDKPSSLVDAARSIPGGIAQGLTGIVGLPGTLSDMASSGLDAIANKITGANISTAHNPVSSQALDNVVSKPTGGYYQPQTTAGRYAQTAASFAPALAGGEASLPARLMGRVLAPAAGAQLAGSGISETDHPILHGAAEIGGAIAGGGLAGGARVGASALGSKMADLLLGKAGSVNPNAADLAGKAAGLGIDIRPGQLSPNRFTNTADDQLSRLPFTGYGDAGPKISTEAQNTQFTRALGKTIGVNADALTPDVVSKAKGDIGAMFNRGLEGVTLSAKPETDKAFTSIKDGIEDIQPALTSEDYRRLTGTLSKIKDSVLNGLTGEQYQSMRQRGGLLDSLSNDANPTVANLGKTMRETLDDAFQAQAPADKAELIGQARQLYRNFKVIEPLADKAPLGNISPPLVLGQVNKAYPNLATAGDIGDLGRIGQSFLKVPSNSNTAERSLVLSAIKNPLKAVGELASMPVAATVGRGLGAAINSKAAMARLLADPAATQIAQTPKLLPRLLMMK